MLQESKQDVPSWLVTVVDSCRGTMSNRRPNTQKKYNNSSFGNRDYRQTGRGGNRSQQSSSFGSYTNQSMYNGSIGGNNGGSYQKADANEWW